MRQSEPMPAPQALLFDLGGVLVDVDFSRALSAWLPHSSLPAGELKQRFRFDGAYERHERGEIDAHTYFDHLRSTLHLSASYEEIARGWNAIFVREITATRLLVQAARQALPCYAFTNTNATHMACWTALFPQVFTAFDRVFASFEIGLRKPERAAFEHIWHATGMAASSILFFDDSAENVQGASAAGLQTVWVRSPEDVAVSLRSLR